MKQYWQLIFVIALLMSTSTGAVAQQALLVEGVDENMNPVDMADLIDGRPLVTVVSSCT